MSVDIICVHVELTMTKQLIGSILLSFQANKERSLEYRLKGPNDCIIVVTYSMQPAAEPELKNLVKRIIKNSKYGPYTWSCQPITCLETNIFSKIVRSFFLFLEFLKLLLVTHKHSRRKELLLPNIHPAKLQWMMQRKLLS